MCGVSNRTTEREEREQRFLQFIQRNDPVRSVARMEGIDYDYALKLLRKVAKQHGLTYQPSRIRVGGKEEIVGITDESRPMRARLGDHLYHLNRRPTVVARQFGVTARRQKYAQDAPFNYDWSVSQIERLARDAGVDFKTFMLQLLLTPTELEKAKRAWSK
jgi:hypothetical protein